MSDGGTIPGESPQKSLFLTPCHDLKYEEGGAGVHGE